MTETSNDFRDDAAIPARSSEPLAAETNPYLAPEAASAHPQPKEVSAKGPRLPAAAMILLGQIPYYGALIAYMVSAPTPARYFGGGSGLPGGGVAMAVFFVLAADNLTFNARSLCSGPGRFLPRAATVALCQAAACFAVGWIPTLTTLQYFGASYDRVEFADFSANLIWVLPLALVPAAVLRACGSFDFPRSERSPVGRLGDWLFVAVAAALVAAALVPMALGYFDVDRFVYRIQRVVPRELEGAVLILPLAFLALAGQSWRVAIRGNMRGSLWKTIPVAISAALQVLAVGVVFALPAFDSRAHSGPVGVALLFALFVVPILRETVVRFAGYRAANLYVERRKARQRAAEAASSGAAPE